MPLSAALKDVLACPQCKGQLQFHEEKNEIHCTRCKLAYPIKDGIPVMLADEARPLT